MAQANKSQSPSHFILAALVLAVLLGCLVAVLMWSEQAEAPRPKQYASGTYVTLKNQTFKVQIASTPAARAQGLSGTNKLPGDQGMLFLFDPLEAACFWMKDMRYNLDILWFDANNKLIYQQQNLSPASYPKSYCPPAAAHAVLEVDAGTAQRLNLKPGDDLTITELN